MATNLGRYSDKVWDRFFDFVFCRDEQLTREEVRAELERYRLDPAPAVARVRAALEERRARESLLRAREQRSHLISKLKEVAAPVSEAIRESLQELIGRLSGSQQAAYFHKLEKAATEQDLQSLLEDLHRLDALSEEDDGSEPRK